MPINNSYDEAAIVEAIATALDNFYTNLIKKVDSLNVKTVMKRKNPYLFRAKAMNGALLNFRFICYNVVGERGSSYDRHNITYEKQIHGYLRIQYLY